MRGESLSHFCPFFFSSFLERCEGRGECSNDKRNVNCSALWNNNTGRWQADSWWQSLSPDRAHKETGGGIKNEPGPVLQARGKPRLSTSTHRETDNVNINTPWWLLSDKCKQALHTYTPTTAPKKIITKKIQHLLTWAPNPSLLLPHIRCKMQWEDYAAYRRANIHITVSASRLIRA